MPEEFSPSNLLLRAIKAWKFILIVTILGGLAGWLVNQIQPPLFEGQAYVPFDFDLARTGKITEAEEDITMGMAGTILSASPVPDQVYAAAHQQGIPITGEELMSSVTWERRSYRWVIRVVQRDPQTAQFLAKAWVDAGFTQIREAARHAETADRLRLYQDSLIRCLERSAAGDAAAPECPLRSLVDVQREIQQTGQAYLAEKTAARGLLPYLLYDIPQVEPLFTEPVRYNRGLMILVGLLIGLLAGTVAVASGILEPLFTRSKDASASSEPRP